MPFVEPHLSEVPDPNRDPIGYNRHFISAAISEVGNRVKVSNEDLTDNVITVFGKHLSRLGGYGNAPMILEKAKQQAMSQNTPVEEALEQILSAI